MRAAWAWFSQRLFLPLCVLAVPLYEAGLRRINVHLDTLDRDRFIRITRRDELDRVLAGIAACRRLGFGPIKINAVAVKGLVEPDIVPLARFGRENGMEVRFIEFMPLDAQGIWDRASVLTAGEIVETLAREIAPLIEIPDADPRERFAPPIAQLLDPRIDQPRGRDFSLFFLCAALLHGGVAFLREVTGPFKS